MAVTRVSTLIVLALLASGCADKPRVLSVHLADQGERHGTDRLRLEMTTGEAPLYAEPAAVLDERDFRSATMGVGDTGLPQLRLCLTPGGKEKFAQVVQRNAKRRLVFFVKGKLLFAPVIDSNVVPECMQIDGDVRGEHLAALQEAIR